MRVVVAPDSFKGSCTAVEAAAALAAGLRRGLPAAQVDEVPVADGGEGTLDVLLAAAGGEERSLQVSGPLGEPVRARWGRLPDGRAVIEMAEAAGLLLLPAERRDPLRATTRGVGELLRAARAEGCREAIVGLGGSGTVDGGAGAAQALGARLLDDEGRELGPGGAALVRLARVEAGAVPRDLALTLACDVDNPLCGPQGAAAVYGPQKGADPAAVAELERGLARWAEVLERDLGRALGDLPGAGAAGGLAAGLLACCQARLAPGVELVLEALDLPARLAGADLVVTGEGRLDGQTLRDKAPLGVARAARAAGVPVVAVGGAVTAEAAALHEHGVAALLCATPGPMPLAEALARGPEHLRRLGEELGRLLALGAAPGGRPPATIDP